MPQIKNKIQQLKDAISLDFAKGSDLNVISGNLGISRPILGFTDDVWRALTKELALDYKQVESKFRDVLSIVVGPDTTRVTNITQSYPAGVKKIQVNDSSLFPQTGILILDRGMITEETIAYKFIDRFSNVITLAAPTVFSHQAPALDGETVLLSAIPGQSTVLAVNTEFLPQTGFPKPLVLGRGTEQEEAVSVIGNNTTTGQLLLSAQIVNEHKGPEVGYAKSTLAQTYARGSFILSVVDSSVYPVRGVLKTGYPYNTDWQTTGFQVGPAGSTSTKIQLSSGLLTPNSKLAGSYVALFGPASGADRGPFLGEFLIGANTASDITLAGGISFPVTPNSSYSFDILYTAEYLETEPGQIHLKYTLPSELPLPAGTTLEYLDVVEHVTTGTVQVLGTDWKIVQATPKVVDILIPLLDSQRQNLRTASYIHDVYDPSTPNSVVDALSNAGDEQLQLSSTSTFPRAGSILIDDSGPNEEYAAFTKRDATKFFIPFGLDLTHVAPETVDLYQPVHAGTDRINGDVNGIVPCVWPGPYVFDPDSLEQKSTTITTLTQNLAAPQYLSLGVVAGAGPKAIEVESARLFPSSGTFSVRLESEVMTATAVSLALRCQSQLNGAHAVSNTTLNVDPGTLNPGGLSSFPNASGYRIKIGRGTPNCEIAYVTSISPGSNTITISAPGLRFAQPDNALVELVCDTVTVSQIDVDHVGLVPYASRLPGVFDVDPESYIPLNYEAAVKAEVLYSSFNIASGSGFSSADGNIILAFGGRIAENRLASAPAASTSVVLNSSNAFPSTGIVEILSGGRHPVLLTYTANNTGTETLTLTETTRSAFTGQKIKLVGGRQEEIKYSTRSGNTLQFSTPIVVATDHQIGEQVSYSQVSSTPRTDGFSFPLRAPLDPYERLRYLFDLIRAAGVQVNIIYTN